MIERYTIDDKGLLFNDNEGIVTLYHDHLAEVERAAKIALQKNAECDVKDFCEYVDTNTCEGCIVDATMEELKK